MDCHFLLQGIFPIQGSNLSFMSPALAGRFFMTSATWEAQTIKKTECQRIDPFKLLCWRRIESPLDCKEFKPVNPKENQPWILIGRTDAEAEVPILLPPDAKSQPIGKDSDDLKDGAQEEKEAAEAEMVKKYHWLNGCEFEQTLGDSKGQESLVCCSSWSHKELDMTEQLNNTRIIRKDWCWRFQYFGYLVGRADTLENTLMMGRLKAKGVGGGRRWYGYHNWLNGQEFEQTQGGSGGQRNLHATVHRVTKSQTWLSDWTTTTLRGKLRNTMKRVSFLIAREK